MEPDDEQDETMTRTSPPISPLVAIIDDEEDITTYLGLALEDSGFRVASTTNPSEAIPMLEEAGPDLICIDLLMPEQTGISLYAELVNHSRFRSVPIVILSGLAAREDMPNILRQAGDLPQPADFIEKPVDIQLFLRTVGALTEWPARS